MSSGYPVRDSVTLLRRNLVRARRYPAVTVAMIVTPVILLLLFVYVFGATLGGGLTDAGVSHLGAAAGNGRSAYANYVAPAIVLLTVIGGAQGTAIAVSTDMTEGIIARFKTMAIWRPAVLSAHVIAAVLQSLLGVAVVIPVALAVGFRPSATVAGWAATIGLLTLVAIALTWLSVAFGLHAKTVAGASNLPLPLMLLPFLGSGFVPTTTLPTGLRWFGQYQPFTPINDTLRGLLLGGHVGTSWPAALAWLGGVTLAGYLWAKHLYDHRPPANP